jgi:IPT/TIG domain-containing protein
MGQDFPWTVCQGQFVIVRMMDQKGSAAIIIVLIAAGVFVAQSSSSTGRRFENQYLTMTILPDWTVDNPVDQRLNLIHGKYLLSIDPIFTHASGVTCGRFEDVASGPSVAAVMSNVDHPAGGFECALWPPKRMIITKAMALNNLYTDSSKAANGCTFPSGGQPVWFGSYFCGEGSESEYAISLAYDTVDVNSLPKKGSLELTHILGEVAAMLKTLHLKPPIVISRVYPQSAPPGATVTIYGSGFNVPNYSTAVSFRDFPNNPMPTPIVAADGKSLTFQVPTSRNTISCQAGYIEVGENCVPVPVSHVDINDCPHLSGESSNFCGIPIPPATYEIWVTAEGSGVNSNPVPLTVTEPNPTPVSISLMYPNYLVSAGDTITVRGTGFTPSGNTVRIGSAVVNNLSSLDGKTIMFQAPTPAGSSFIHGIRIYEASVSNANGESNSISFDYR